MAKTKIRLFQTVLGLERLIKMIELRTGGEEILSVSHSVHKTGTENTKLFSAIVLIKVKKNKKKKPVFGRAKGAWSK